MVAADGSVRQQTPKFVPAALETTPPLLSGSTPATAMGPLPERVLCILAAAVALVMVIRRRTVRSAHSRDEDVTGDRAFDRRLESLSRTTEHHGHARIGRDEHCVGAKPYLAFAGLLPNRWRRA
ncbi:hypothetical protein [Nocardia nova]|uniref:hypothetical protein n=1 Tax=Nocardia nova TaxID=37330 RepID=UPI00046CC30D|nr:hypothetical protein [Nocardia nova]